MRTTALCTTIIVGFLLTACGGKPEVVGNDDPDRDAGTGGAGSMPDAGTGGGFVLPDAACQGASCGGSGGEDDSGPAPYCGDGFLNQSGEQCDDGDGDSGDGCSAACELEANYVCPNPGESCVSTVACGDGRIGGEEQCDDGNEDAGDGCDGECQLEAGWECPFVGLACVAAECGDGIVAGVEECDDADPMPHDGCDENCRLEEGFKCDVPGQPCETTTCGDGIAEGLEQCDDGNFDLGDGCTPFCKLEPDCSAGACVSACGDGILLGDEECDDGNTRGGDGCSSQCTVEPGFYCSQPDLPVELEIPLVVRDFHALDPLPSTSGSPADYDAPNHVDFELIGGSPSQSEPTGLEDGEVRARIVRAGQGSSATGRGLDLGRPGETFEIRHLDGSVIATVSLAGKPVYALDRPACDKTALPTAANSWDKCTRTTMDADSFHTWYVDADAAGNTIAWPNFLGRGETSLQTLTLLRGSFSSGGTFTAGGNAYTYDSRYMRTDGTIANVDGFYPIDALGETGTSCGGNDHNFHFTSEVRFWFEYDATEEPRLDFSGDDDVWVYVNGHLALDIGGIHGREAKSFTIDAANAAAWGLDDGSVYEIAVFQAERNQCDSNYWLTLEGFNASKSQCESRCGDGIIASDELCDDGDENHPTNPPPYGKCGPDCKTRGPSCGDGQVDDGHEECDDGVNISVYDFNGAGCAPGCKKPPFCGDGEIQSTQEECDDGVNDGSYGTCTPECKLAPRCGDGVTNRPQEECDDGPSGSSRCSPQCFQTEPE